MEVLKDLPSVFGSELSVWVAWLPEVDGVLDESVGVATRRLGSLPLSFGHVLLPCDGLKRGPESGPSGSGFIRDAS